MLRPRSRWGAARKVPQRPRSQFTVDVLLDATLAVLSAEGPQRLTTTRVAKRAGVSVGAVYQYFDNRLALLYATHRRHVLRIADTMIRACRQQEGRTLSAMVRGLVHTYVEIKIDAAAEARALCHVTAELNAAEMIAPEALHVREAVERMLDTTADARFADPPLTAWMFVAAMIGPVRSALEEGMPPAPLRALGEQTVTLCESYLRARALHQ